MRPVKPWMIVAAWILGALTFAPTPDIGTIHFPSIPWLFPIGGGTASFKLPDGVSVAAIVVYDGTPAAVQALTSEQSVIISNTGDGGARKTIETAGGKFQLIKAGSTDEDLKYEDQWVKDAYAKRGAVVPWMVAAGVRGGLSQAIPPAVKSADVVAKLKSISGK